MAITVLHMAAIVLKEEKRPLTAWEIWQAAENKGYDKLVDSTPSISLSALIDADVRGNPSSIFVTLGDPPERFILRSHMYNIRPGKKVRIIEHLDYIVDDFTHITQVVATKDSIGTILSYEEYLAHEEDLEKKHGYFIPLRRLEWVKSGIRERTHYPIRFDEIVPMPDEDYTKLKQKYATVDLVCRVGSIEILPTESFVVI